MKKIITLTERDLSKIVKRVINEMDEKKYRVVMMSKDIYNSSPSVESGTISEFSKETDERTFEYKGAALRHAERMYEKNPDESMILIIVDNNNEPYGSVPGIVKGPLTRRFTGFGRGYDDELMEEEEMSIPTATKGGTVKSLAQKYMTSTDKKNWKGLYDLTQNDNTNFEILTVDGSPSVGGVSKNLEGKYLKPTDYINVPNSGDEVYFKPSKGFRYEAYVYNKDGVVKFGFAEE